MYVGKKTEICSICNQEKSRGIHLYTTFICEECEHEMVHTETNDPRYSFFINQLKTAIKSKMYR
ncbi:sigma factor G inhibitor Gin [Weizmannia ginsengihumi]|nr:sigma factor G inhibitor Gin [Heyndrickxia ginsengihumi]